HVERAGEALRVVVRLDRHPFLEGRPDEHDVLDDGRRRVEAGFARFEIDLLAVARRHPDLQIDDAVLAEGLDRRSGFGAELDETISGRDVNDPIVPSAVSPVRQAATRKLAWRDRGAEP